MSLRVVVEADGGSRGNPGPAGFGAVVRHGVTGELLAERSGGLAETTNNVAEYEGLLAGLRAAADVGATEVDVRMDSKLVVEQMSGRWRVKHANLQPLAEQARALVAGFEQVTFEWIPRARNAHADRLANEAMDRQAGTEQPQRVAWHGAMGKPTRFLLVRHGQTPLSVDRRYSGRGFAELTELGEHQAQAVAKRLSAREDVTAAVPIIVSPLRRAMQTAQSISDATGGELVAHDGLLETDFGAWEGLTFLEAAEQYADLHSSWIGDPTVQPPGGESMESVFERVRAACDELVRRYAGQTVVVVSHVTPIKSFLRLGLGVGASLYYRLHLDLASLSIVEFYPDGNASVRLVNDTSHLA